VPGASGNTISGDARAVKTRVFSMPSVACGGAVTVSVAGYDDDIDWTLVSAGLAPAGIAASFAARAGTEGSALRDGYSANPGH
jgi:hypothetical protein